MTKGKDYAFGSQLFTEGSTPSTPSAGQRRTFWDSTTHRFMAIDSSGIILPVQAFAGVQAYNNTTQAISANTNTACALNAEDFDTNAFHDNSTNNSHITIPTGWDGYWMFLGSVYAASNPSALVAWLRKNGTTNVRGTTHEERASGAIAIPVNGIASLVATDFIEMMVFISNAINIGDTTNVEQQVTLRAVYLGR